MLSRRSVCQRQLGFLVFGYVCGMLIYADHTQLFSPRETPVSYRIIRMTVSFTWCLPVSPKPVSPKLGFRVKG